MTQDRRNAICTLLKGIETGDPASVAVVNEAKYIQHNPQTHEGSEGLAALFKRLSQTNPRVNIVRIFSDGDYVFGHTEYDFSTRRIGFEAFRFEGDQAVEHWDNIQPRNGPNASGRTMVDGPTEAADLDKTEDNRATARAFIEEVLIARKFEELDRFIDETGFIEHNPELSDGRDALREALQRPSLNYQTLHRVLAEGNFVLCVSEGERAGVHSSFYDLFRLAKGKIAEHWDTTEKVPPASEWKNKNGKF